MSPTPEFPVPDRLRVVRQVIDGAESFISQVTGWRDHYIRPREVSSLTTSIITENEAGDPVINEVNETLYKSPVEVYPEHDLRLVLFCLSAAYKFRSHYGLGRVTASLHANNNERLNRLNRVMTDNNLNPDATPLRFGALIEEYTPGKGTELSLVPHPNYFAVRALMQQTKLIPRMLLENDSTKKYAIQGGIQIPHMPFAFIPDDRNGDCSVSPKELEKFLDGVDGIIKPRVTLGEVRVK